MPKTDKRKRKKKFKCSEPTCKSVDTPQKRSHPLKNKNSKYATLVYCNRCYCREFRYGSASRHYPQWVASLPKGERDLWLQVRPLPTDASTSGSGSGSASGRSSPESVSAKKQGGGSGGEGGEVGDGGEGGGGSDLSVHPVQAIYDSSEGENEGEQELVEYYISKETKTPVQDLEPCVPENQISIQRDACHVGAAIDNWELGKPRASVAGTEVPQIPDAVQTNISPLDADECIDCVDFENPEDMDEEKEKERKEIQGKDGEGGESSSSEPGDDEGLQDLIDVD